MAVKKEVRLQVGKALLDGSLTLDEARAKYKVGQTAVYNWECEYRESVGDEKPKPADQGSPDYGSMSKEQLMKELMKRDIEIARSKKGYAVRGGGSKKEFVSIKGSSTKS
jgi:transposase